MKRLLIVLVTSLVLGLVGGVGTALAGVPAPPQDGAAAPLQSATQSNDGTNTADQSGTSAPVVVSGPNIALANGGDGKSSCNPCGDGGSGTVDQNSGNTVDASVANTANQTNTQSNSLGQSQTAGLDGKSSGAEQSADQSNNGTNYADQSGTSAPVVVSGPNVAALNHGDVSQSSGNTVDASTTNNANQANNQSSSAGQSQTVAGDRHGGCRSKEHGASGPSQSAKQSNEGTNTADQSGTSAPIVVSGGNIALLNKGDVSQSSGNTVDASTTNNADQSNRQSNSAGQSQTVAGTDNHGCCSKNGEGYGASQSAEQSNRGENEANQSGTSAPIVVSGPNVAIANGWGREKCSPCGGSGGNVSQNSGNTVDASVTNTANQTNNQSNVLGQTQWVEGGGSGCRSQDGGPTQTADQSNWGENKADQSGTSVPVVLSGPNVAAFNQGDVNQSSGNTVDASVTNTADQTNNQSNSLGQSQWVRGTGRSPRCEPKRCEPKCEPRPCRPKCDERSVR
jgi:hypothetical protein